MSGAHLKASSESDPGRRKADRGAGGGELSRSIPNADIALYRAEASGGDSVAVADGA